MLLIEKIQNGFEQADHHLHRAGSQKQIPGDRFHFVNVNTLKKGGNYRG